MFIACHCRLFEIHVVEFVIEVLKHLSRHLFEEHFLLGCVESHLGSHLVDVVSENSWSTPVSSDAVEEVGFLLDRSAISL